MQRDRLWSLVLNGTRARILRGLKPGEGAHPSELVLRAEHRRLRKILAEGAGPGADPADPMAADQRDFIHQVIAVLETHRLAGDFDRLAVFAAPEALAMWRREVPDRLAARVIHEGSQNLIHLPARDLAQAVGRALRRP